MGRCAIDLVGQDDVVEQRTFLDGEIAGLGPVHLGSHQVGGKQVGGELDAFEIGIHGVGQGFDRTGLGQPGNTFNENMPSGEQPHEQTVNQFPLPHHDLADFLPDAVDYEMFLFNPRF